MTSSPHAERWQFAHEAGAPIMLSLADDAHYLLRCQVPEQTLAALADKDPLLRMRILAQLVEALGTHSPEKPHPLAVQTDFARIVPLAQDSNLIVRRLALEVLGKSKDPTVVEALLAALGHADPVVANRAATSLAALAAPSENNPIDPMRPQILTALRGLFARHGDTSARTDRDWGYRPVGNALLKLGPEGEAVLQSFMDQREDHRLAELAWKALHLRHENNQFNEVSETENAAAHALRPVFEP